MDISFLIEEVEKVSQGYADRLGITRDPDWFVLKLQEELGELVQSYLMMSGRARKKNKTEDDMRSDFQKELADVFCHTLLLAKYYNVDLEKQIKDKWLVWLKE